MGPMCGGVSRRASRDGSAVQRESICTLIRAFPGGACREPARNLVARTAVCSSFRTPVESKYFYSSLAAVGREAPRWSVRQTICPERRVLQRERGGTLVKILLKVRKGKNAFCQTNLLRVLGRAPQSDAGSGSSDVRSPASLDLPGSGCRAPEDRGPACDLKPHPSRCLYGDGA